MKWIDHSGCFAALLYYSSSSECIKRLSEAEVTATNMNPALLASGLEKIQGLGLEGALRQAVLPIDVA